MFPDIGFGTYTLTDRDECIDAVTTALETGYRFLDTAQVYHNEVPVGDAIEASTVPREDIVVATKLHWERLGYEDALQSAVESCERLRVGTIDLLYVHWPVDTYDPHETLPALDELVDRDVVEHVGVCNFSPELLDEAREVLDAPLAVHQVECHPFLQQEELVAYADEHGHELVAAVPLGKGSALDLPAVQTVAERHDATPAQVALAWQIRRGVTPIPKARSDHVAENYGALDVVTALDDEDVARIDGIEERRRIVDRPEAPWNRE